MNYCAGCGEQKRLVYPRWAGHFCSQRCAAVTSVIQLEAGDGADFYCAICGEVGCQSYHEEGG